MGVHNKDNPQIPEVKALLGVPETEPIFIIRGQDVLAYPTLEYYTRIASDAGCDPSFLEELRQVQNAFSHFSVEESGQIKVPD